MFWVVDVDPVVFCNRLKRIQIKCRNCVVFFWFQKKKNNILLKKSASNLIESNSIEDWVQCWNDELIFVESWLSSLYVVRRFHWINGFTFGDWREKRMVRKHAYDPWRLLCVCVCVFRIVLRRSQSDSKNTHITIRLGSILCAHFHSIKNY